MSIEPEDKASSGKNMEASGSALSPGHETGHATSREELERARLKARQGSGAEVQADSASAAGISGKLPAVTLLVLAAAGAGYYFISDDKDMPADTKSISVRSNEPTGKVPGPATEPAGVIEREHGINTSLPPDESDGQIRDNYIGPAERYRQQKELKAEAREAELAIQREAERKRRAAELKARQQAENERLAAEQRRVEAERKAANKAEKARLEAEARRTAQRRKQAELEAARKAEQARIAAELEQEKQAEQLRIQTELEAAREVAQQKAAEQAVKAESISAQAETGEPDKTKDAKFSTNPCDGPTAQFLSTCR